MKFAKKKIGGSNLVKLLVAGITKSVEEPMLAPVIGNGTVLSGATKLFVGGWLLPKFAGKSNIAEGISLGFGIDGVEDIIRGLLRGNILGGIVGGGANTQVI